MSIILFIIILVVLILVHEFGHFVVAKWAGIRVDEFSIGFFRPKLFSKKIGETEYSFRPLLLGGYVKIFGEDPNEESTFGPDKERSFVNKPKWIQAAVLVAGVGFNIILAWIIFSFLFVVGMPTVLNEEEDRAITNPKLMIIDVLPESPAGLVGLKSGDELLELMAGEDSTGVVNAEEVIAFISSHANQEITVSHKRGKDILETSVTPTENLIPGEPERAAIGISMGIVGTLQLPLHKALWEGGKFTLSMLGIVGTALGGFFASIFTFTADFSQVAGPIGIVGLVGDAAALGFVSLLFFTAIISLNLAVINILPIPALDGGRLLFVIIEAIKGSPLKPTFINALNAIFFYLLILLILVISFNDVIRLIAN